MKIIDPSVEILEQQPGLNGIYQQIERAGRTCYKSEDRITTGSSKKFVDRMIDSQHYAMLEHGTVYLKMFRDNLRVYNYSNNKYSVVTESIGNLRYITTNLRVLVENGWMDDLEHICEPTEYHERRVTVLFHTQIATSREYNRHRANSMAESSTRYCNYSKDKFGNELSVNVPKWVEGTWAGDTQGRFKEVCRLIAGNDTGDLDDIDWWCFGNMASELAYMSLIKLGKKPQEARAVLPLDTNTDLVHTAFVKDWEHFFDLRALDKTGVAHPDAKALALPLYWMFKEKGLISE